MEAENKPSQDLKTDASANVRKPLRARKTMTLSNRKQMGLLKNLPGLGKAGNGTYSVDKYVQLRMIEMDRLGCSPCKETNPSPDSKPTLAKEPVARLVVNSKISIYSDNPDVSGNIPYNGCNANSDVKRFLNSGHLEDFLYSFCNEESGASVSKPVEVRIYSEPTAPQTSSLASCASDPHTLAETEDTKETPANPAAAALEQEHESIRSQEGNSLPSDALGERRPSECEEVVAKCRKLSDETSSASGIPPEKSQSGLEKMRCFIHSHIENMMGDLDCKVQQLNERVDHTQCLQKHEEIAIVITKKISRLDRRVNSVADFQKARLPKKASLPGANGKITILNVTKPGKTNNPSVPPKPPKRRLAEACEATSKTARSSAKETCRNVEPSCTQAGNTADVPRKRASSNAQASPKAPNAAQNAFLIDLTDEDNRNPEEVSVKANPSPESTKSQQIDCQKSPSPKPLLFQQVAAPSKKIPAATFPHLPPLPKIQLPPQQHTSSFMDSLPPQKLDLAVAQVQNPKGIALQWNISQVDPRCAPIESFHLFICTENTDTGTLSAWRKTTEIKALALPMACSLSQIVKSGNCYFVMQSKDVYGRFGPFCDIQSLSVV